MAFAEAEPGWCWCGTISVLVAIGGAQTGYRTDPGGKRRGQEISSTNWICVSARAEERGLKGAEVVPFLDEAPGVGGEPGRVLSGSLPATLRGSFL